MVTDLPTPCTSDCGTGRRRRGYCMSHYTRYLNSGQIPRVLYFDNVAGFWARIVKGDDPNDCWKWTASVTKDGYGRLHFNGRNDMAHRVSFFIHKGRWPKNLVLHKCDNPPCCNPKHLYDGTQKDNARDMVRRKRCKPYHLTRNYLIPEPAEWKDTSWEKYQKIVRMLQRGWTMQHIADCNKVPVNLVKYIYRNYY